MLEWAKRILVSQGIPDVPDDGPCELFCPDVEACELAPWEKCERRIARARQASPDAESIPLSNSPDQYTDRISRGHSSGAGLCRLSEQS